MFLSTVNSVGSIFPLRSAAVRGLSKIIGSRSFRGPYPTPEVGPMAVSGFTQELVNVVKELQKLSKELGPVKTALAALKKREQATPNPQAAAVSIEKIAARVTGVHAKYLPYMERAQQLVQEDVPHVLLQTPVVGIPREALEKEVDNAHSVAEQRTRGLTGIADQSGADEDGITNRSHLPAALRPGSLLEEVCPSQFPYAVPPEYYELYHDQLRLRLEMVDYLIETGRPAIAKAVQQGYGLPSLWFPSLSAMETATAALLSPSNNSFLSVSPAVTPAWRGARMPPAVITSPDQIVTTPGGSGTAAGVTAETPVRPTAEVYTLLSPDHHELSPAAHGTTGLLPPATDMPDLVARVVSTGIFLKDEYFDRMVLEHHMSARVDSGAENADDGREKAATREYGNALHARIRSIVRSHICTQSGSTQFDLSMMNVIEELLACGLLHRQVSSPEGSVVEPTSTLTPCQLLLAEGTWSNDILFIRRPTRYYCVHSGITMDGSSDDTYPLALPNGMVVSKDGLTNLLLTKRSVTGSGRWQTAVVCPPSQTAFDLENLTRIFVV